MKEATDCLWMSRNLHLKASEKLSTAWAMDSRLAGTLLSVQDQIHAYTGSQEISYFVSFQLELAPAHQDDD